MNQKQIDVAKNFYGKSDKNQPININEILEKLEIKKDMKIYNYASTILKDIQENNYESFNRWLSLGGTKSLLGRKNPRYLNFKKWVELYIYENNKNSSEHDSESGVAAARPTSEDIHEDENKKDKSEHDSESDAAAAAPGSQEHSEDENEMIKKIKDQLSLAAGINKFISMQDDPYKKKELELIRNKSMCIYDKLEKLDPSMFPATITPKEMFLNIYNDLIGTGIFNMELFKILEVTDFGKSINKNTIKEISKYLSKFNKSRSFNDRLEILIDRIKDYKNNDLKDFKKGDPLDKNAINEFIRKLIKTNFNKSEMNSVKIKNAIESVLKPLGITVNIYPYKNSIGIHYIYDKIEIRERTKGKVDHEAENKDIFFTYDIHEVIEIIEKHLGVKLTDQNKMDIESIFEQETRNLRNRTNINHGTSEINKLIIELEKYVNSKKRIDNKTFTFSESNRFRLKEIFKSILKNKNKKPRLSGKEIMNRLKYLIL